MLAEGLIPLAHLSIPLPRRTESGVREAPRASFPRSTTLDGSPPDLLTGMLSIR